MNLLYYVFMIIWLLIISSVCGFEYMVVVGISLILLGIQELKDEIKKKDGVGK